MQDMKTVIASLVLLAALVCAGCDPAPATTYPDGPVVPTSAPLPTSTQDAPPPVSGDPEPESGIHIPHPHVYACIGPRRHLIHVGVCL